MSHSSPTLLSLSFYSNASNPVIHGSNDVTSKKTKLMLNPTAVRERSLAIPGCNEIVFNNNTNSSIICFLVLGTGSITMVAAEASNASTASEKNTPARVTVFCDTGTVGTAKVMNGKLRQTFRRNVDSLDTVERLLTYPEGPVEINENLIGFHDTDVEVKSDRRSSSSSIISAHIDFQKELELADVGLCILGGEREKLTKHLRILEEVKEDEEERLQKLLLKNHRKQQKKLKLQQHKQQQRIPGTLKPDQLQSWDSDKSSNNGSSKLDGNKNQTDINKSVTSSANHNRTGRRAKLLYLGSRHNKNNITADLNNGKNKKKGNKSTDGWLTSNVASSRMRSAAAAISGDEDSSAATSVRKKSNRKFSNNSDNCLGGKVRSAQPTVAAKVVAKHDSYKEKASSSSNTASNKQPSATIDVHEVTAYEFHFKLPADVMKQVDQCLRDIAKMNKIVKGVATNGRGTVFLYGNGGVAYTPSIPRALYHKLRQLRSSSYSSRPCFVALGSRDRYYVSFNDNTADWKGSNILDKTLKRIFTKNNSATSSASKRHLKSCANDSAGKSSLPRSVAFGSTYDTFFIIYHDGSWQYQGRGIPESLEDKLKERHNRADLLHCNLGPNGEWFLKAENGKMWWSGISSELDEVLQNITSTGYLYNMDFGENGSYFISYDEV